MPPAELVTFMPGFWSALVAGDDAHRGVAAELDVWKAARRAWRDQHGWPAAFGDSVDFIRHERDTRRRVTYGPGAM